MYSNATGGTYVKPKGSKRKFGKRSMYAPTVNRPVQRVVSRNVENKIQYKQETSKSITTGAVAPGLLTLPMIPYAQISQGTGQGDRIGNTIRTKKVMFNFALHPAPYNASTNTQPVPQDVIMMFGKVKNSRAQQPIASDFAKLWQIGNSSTGPYSTSLDLLATVNKDWFTVYKQLHFKLGYADALSSGNSTANQFFSNNDFQYSIVRRLDITNIVPKIVKFNDTTSQNTNDGLWMWCWCVNADGTFTAQAIPALMDYYLTYEYEDA